MRFLLPKKMHKELQARKEYIYDSLHLWTGMYDFNDEFMCLEGFPFRHTDVMFIVGHNCKVYEFIKINLESIYEKTIVAITCDGNVGFSSIKLKGKTLYIAHQNENNYADLFKGSTYGFDFDLTESEIIFYNSRKSKDIYKRLDSAFTKVLKR